MCLELKPLEFARNSRGKTGGDINAPRRAMVHDSTANQTRYQIHVVLWGFNARRSGTATSQLWHVNVYSR